MLASRRAVAPATRSLARCYIQAAPGAARHSSTEAPAAADTAQPPTPSAAPKPAYATTAQSLGPYFAKFATASTASRTSPPPPQRPRFASATPYANNDDAALRAKTSPRSGDSPRYELSKVVNRVKLPAAAEAREVTPPDVNWVDSFHGVSVKPVTEEQFQVLMQPLLENDIEIKPDGIIYLPEIKYRRRLNEAFGPMGWGLIPKSEPVIGESIVTREYALIVDGRFVSQAQGENGYFGRDQLPSAVEGCKSNALMRCCKDLGIASELWDPHFVRWFKRTRMEEAWVEHVVTKKRRTLWFRKGAVDVTYPYKLTGSK